MDENVTLLLRAWQEGEPRALERMMPLVAGELRRLARRKLRSERAGHALQSAALVNEAFLRLVDQRHVSWENRAQFFALAARLMRRVLVDHARRRRAEKRGGEHDPVALQEAQLVASAPGPDPVDVIAVRDALGRLEALDRRQAEVVELRVFGGLKNNEIAAALGISLATVKREWEAAKAWLHRELGGG
jgi:RNA polymerase sigma factor (TIGR02999 family)